MKYLNNYTYSQKIKKLIMDICIKLGTLPPEAYFLEAYFDLQKISYIQIVKFEFAFYREDIDGYKKIS